MPRKEFSAKTKRLAWARANGMCECVVDAKTDQPILTSLLNYRGSWKRCCAPIDLGCFIYEHVNAVWMSDDNSLENCAVYCLPCAKFKTKSDRKRIDKVKRILKKRAGLRKPRGRALPGTKRSGLKRKFGGKIVHRI
jgi:hypothetical protein